MLDRFPVLRPLLEPGIELLHAEGIEPELTTFPACTAGDLTAFDDEFAIKLPVDFRELFLETNGFLLSWEDGADWGSLSLPDLQELRLFRQRWENGECPTDERITDEIDAESEAILEAAPHWLPFEEEGNGDLLCIDCRTGAVVEACHDWGGANDENGIVYAASISHYIKKCGSISFRSVHSFEMDTGMYEGGWRAIWPSAHILRQYKLPRKNAT